MELVEPFSEGQLIAGRYHVLQSLGAGSCGFVVRVWDSVLESDRVALKILSPHTLLNERAVQRFRNELTTMRLLNHPNIVRVYDFGETDSGLKFISMEYFSGTPLDKLLQSLPEKRLQFANALHLLLQIARGLAAAHAQGVVHRDIKPANILVGADESVRIADFGVSRVLEGSVHLTATGESVGTPFYMSPEQIKGAPADLRSDVYAFGILAYEIVSGRRPFEGNTFFDIALQHLRHPLPSLNLAQLQLPLWFFRFVEKCTMKDPSRRFQGLQPIIDGLESALTRHQRFIAHGYLTPSDRCVLAFKRFLLTANNSRRLLRSLLLINLLTLFVAIRSYEAVLTAPLTYATLKSEQITGIRPSPLRKIFNIRLEYSSQELFRHLYDTFNSSLDAIEQLLNVGIDANSLDSSGVPAIVRAAAGPIQSNFTRESISSVRTSVKLLLDHGADPNDMRSGESPLEAAIARGNWVHVVQLMQNGARVFEKTRQGVPIVNALLSRRDIHFMNRERTTAYSSGLVMLQELRKLKPEIDVNSYDLDGFTPLIRSLYMPPHGVFVMQEIQLFLLEMGADINHPDSNGITFEQHAAAKGLLQTVAPVLAAAAKRAEPLQQPPPD